MLEALEKGVDVLYLVCHGAVSQDVPLIYLEGPDGKADAVDGRKLVERLLGLQRRPTVVMLCSCQSAGSGDERRSDDDGDLAALGPRLAAAGVSAVVGMQGNVAMRTADAFASAFFEALGKDGIVDRAMAVARRSVADRDDWWAPVLFSRLRSGRTYYKPEFASRGDATWQTIGLQIRTGNFTPVLGPGLADAILGSRQDIARGFVERWQMPLAQAQPGRPGAGRAVPPGPQRARAPCARSSSTTSRRRSRSGATPRPAPTTPSGSSSSIRSAPARPSSRSGDACGGTTPATRTGSWPSCP